jgi:hypothetical protein
LVGDTALDNAALKDVQTESGKARDVRLLVLSRRSLIDHSSPRKDWLGSEG